MLSSLCTAFGLGFLYFVSAIPAAVLAGASPMMAGFMAWIGYSCGAMVILCLGTPLREWLFKRCKLSLEPNPEKFFWRIWEKYGILGLGFIAPITLGPQLTALLLLALGTAPKTILLTLSVGVLPWILGYVLMIQCGLHFYA